MNDDVFIIGVPTREEDDLHTLLDQVSPDTQVAEHRYFDGAQYVECILSIGLSAAAWATLRTWIRARAEILKATRISVNGIEFVAVKPKDAERLITQITELREDDDADQ